MRRMSARGSNGRRSKPINAVQAVISAQKSSFWVVLDNRGGSLPHDAEGRRDFEDIPTVISDLVADPYRSLAGGLRQAGGFAKDTTPFNEFIRADFRRRHIKPKDIKADFSAALAKALELAKATKADYLPGWCGPSRRPS